MTTGSEPLGAGRAVELGERLAGGIAGQLARVELVEQLEADGVADALEPGLHAGVAGGNALTRNIVRTCSSVASSPSVLATRMRWRLSP